jgi:hypothetical protein
MEMLIPLEPDRMNRCPKIGDDVFQAAGCLVFFVGVPHLLQVCMLKLLPVGMEVAVEHVVPTNALLLMVYFEMQWWQIVWGLGVIVWIDVDKKGMS